jgi:hypothetical protein
VILVYEIASNRKSRIFSSFFFATDKTNGEERLSEEGCICKRSETAENVSITQFEWKN